MYRFTLSCTAAQLCKPCILKLHYFEKFLQQNLAHQAGGAPPGAPMQAAPVAPPQSPSQEPVAALMTGLHIADIYMVGGGVLRGVAAGCIGRLRWVWRQMEREWVLFVAGLATGMHIPCLPP